MASSTATKDADKTLNVEEFNSNRNSKILSSCKSTFSFINAGYSVFSLSWAIVMLPFLVPFLYFPDIALERGVTKQEAAFIASSMGIGSLAGRAGFGFLGDVKRLETSLIHTVPVILFGALALVFNYVQGFTNFLILAILIGLLSGKYILALCFHQAKTLSESFKDELKYACINVCKYLDKTNGVSGFN